VEQPAIRHLAAAPQPFYRVDVGVPASAPAGTYAFSLVASDVLDPEDRYADGPRVGFKVGAPPPPPKPVITDAGYVATFLGAFFGDLAIVVIVAVVLAVVGLTRPLITNTGNLVGALV